MNERGPDGAALARTLAAVPPCVGEMPRVTEPWGEFRIVREIARGGMGVVCEAYQGSLNRHVALKFLPEHGNLSRFRREAQAAGRLHHTNIVPVFGVGEHQGRHFYVMQYIAGRGLDIVSREQTADAGNSGRTLARLRAREAARIGAQVAGALAYAHGQGVIHRDIKPSNLLLDEQGTVWITDFGLAKADDQENLTLSGDILGTLRYMPPEAFEGKYDARGDIYALGLTLYEMLAVRPAYDETDRARLIRLVTAGNPSRLRDLDRQVPRDLETVIHKAIERDPGHRYQTAALLAEDLRRFIEDRPIRARRIGEVEKFARWCRRSPVPASLVAALLLVFWLGFGLVAWKWRDAVAEREAKEEQVKKAKAAGADARAARDLAVTAEKKALAAADRAKGAEKQALDAASIAGRRLYSSLIDRARLEHDAANIDDAEAILDRCEPARRGWEWHFLKGLDNAEVFTLRGHSGWVDSVAWSADGKWIATSGGGNPYYENAGSSVRPGTVVLWDAATGRPVHTLTDFRHLVGQVAFTPDGRLIGAPSRDGTLRLHEVLTGRLVQTLKGAVGMGAIVMVPGADDGSKALWDIATGARFTLRPGSTEGVNWPLAVSPDGQWMATVGRSVRIWDAARGTEAAWPEHPTTYCSLAISPDSHLLAFGSMYGQIDLRNRSDGRLRQALPGHQGWVRALAFSPDGRSLASTGDDRTARVWDVGSRALVRVIRGHTEMLTGLAFSPAGDRLVTGSQDGTARVWDLNVDHKTGSTGSEPFPQFEAIEAIAYARGGRELRSFTRTGRVYRHTAGSLGSVGITWTDVELGWHTPLEPAAFDALGRRVVAVDNLAPSEAVCLDVDGSGRRTTLRGHLLAVAFATLSADGTRAATAAMSRTPERRTEVFVWDAASGRVLHRREVSGEAIDRLALDPTGRRLAVSAVRIIAASDGTRSPRDPFVAVFDVDSGRELLRREVADDRFPALGFSGDGRRLAAAGVARTVLIWDLDSGTAVVESHQGPPGNALDLAFSPDGRRLAIASREQVKLVDAETAEEVLTLRGRAQLVSTNHGFNPRVRFSPDGRELVAACDDVWDVLAVWSSLQDTPANSPARDRMSHRRAVVRHLQFARLDLNKPADRRLALEHLDHVERIGLESSDEFLTRASKLMDLDLWKQADADVDRAVALAPRDEDVLMAAAAICTNFGRFDRARSWYERMSDPAASLSSRDLRWRCATFVLNGDLARYRRVCEEVVRRLESGQVDRRTAGELAYVLALGPDPGSGVGERLRITQRAYDGTPGEERSPSRMLALLALGAAQVRAGAPERAEPLFRDAIARVPDGPYGATSAAWMAIATWQQRRRDEARSWSARADRFVAEHRLRGHSGPEFRPPEGIFFADWWRILVARREAHALIFDADFPADPFAR
jgi:eukaryotic-like serine/threonine-protein kinase